MGKSGEKVRQGLHLTIPGLGIDFFSYKIYGVLHKSGHGIVNDYPRCTCPLVHKRDTFYVSDGTPMTYQKMYKNSTKFKLF